MKQTVNDVYSEVVLLGVVMFWGAMPNLLGQANGPVQPVPTEVIEEALALNSGNISTRDFKPRLQTRERRYKLNRSDVLQVSFPLAPEFDQTLTVQPDGFVMLRGVGDLKVEGKTMPDVVEAIRTAYSDILRDPVPSVELKEFQKPYFIAAGQVEEPGKYELTKDISVAQAIAVAGGITEDAKHSQVLLFRSVDDTWMEVRQLNLVKLFKQQKLEEDLYVGPGDMVYVPKNFLAKVKAFVPRLRLGIGWW